MKKGIQPVGLIVLDGWGYSEEVQYNAIESARKPNWDRYWSELPHMLIDASGAAVGLPDGQMGNSEVGHMHIGAGRVVPQDFTRISAAIEDGSFFANRRVIEPFAAAAKRGRAVHLLGLLSPGGVHSHQDHIMAMMQLAARSGVERIYVHAFLDGRDTPPRSAADSLAAVWQKHRELGRGRIASIVGRYYAMDRNKHWDRTQLAYALIVDGDAPYSAADPLIALDKAYARGESDEFVKPTVIVPEGGEPARVADGDVVVFMNFRADRARQLTLAFTEPNFDHFERARVPRLERFITLTEYSPDYNVTVAFPTPELRNTFGEYISRHGLTQLRIAETEKYAHVTFFFNGGEERVFEGEDRVLVPSPHVPTYDLKPEMSAFEVTDELVARIASRHYDFFLCNYANADMVGHTGDFAAAVKAIEAIDTCLGRVEAAARAASMELVITADHGNAEKMRAPATKAGPGQAHTAHTENPVPLVYVGRPARMAPTGTLVDIAPTLLALMGLPPPPEMTGTPLVHPYEAASAVTAVRRRVPARSSER